MHCTDMPSSYDAPESIFVGGAYLQAWDVAHGIVNGNRPQVCGSVVVHGYVGRDVLSGHRRLAELGELLQ